MTNENNDVPVQLELTNESTLAVFGPAQNDDLGDYDPFEHRKVNHPTSDLATFIHLLKGCLGSGILAIPMAFSNVGLALGVACMFLIGFICTYCLHILVKSEHALCRRTRVPSLGFAEVAEAAFLQGPEHLRKWSRFAKAVINLFLIITYLGICCVYIGFITNNTKQVVDFHTESDVDVRFFMVALLPLLLVLGLVRNLKYLAPFSMLGNILIAIGMVITFYYIFIDLPSLSERPNFVEVTKLPLFFGTAIFALEGIGVVMPLENNMKTPTHFIGCPGILNTGMGLLVTLYSAVGFFGFLKYGSFTEASITLNLPNEDVLAQVVKLMIAVAIFFTYGLQFYVPMEIIWKNLKEHFSARKLWVEYLIRMVIITGTVAVAIAVPNLGGFISLVGAVGLSTLGLIFPAIIDLITFYENPGFGRYNWHMWKDFLLICFGVVGLLTGSYVSIIEILKS